MEKSKRKTSIFSEGYNACKNGITLNPYLEEGTDFEIEMWDEGHNAWTQTLSNRLQGITPIKEKRKK